MSIDLVGLYTGELLLFTHTTLENPELSCSGLGTLVLYCRKCICKSGVGRGGAGASFWSLLLAVKAQRRAVSWAAGAE